MKLKDISYLEGFLQGLVNKYDPDVVKDAVIKQVWLDPKGGKYKPFHVALIPSHLLRLHSFFRSFDTSLGQGVFEYIAQLIAADNPVWTKAERNYTLTVSTEGGIQGTIATFIEEVKRKKKKPHPLPHLRLTSGDQAIQLRADLYLEDKNSKKYFFEIKTPMPNQDICSQTKEKFLYFVAGIGLDGVYKFCFPYNPWGEERKNYKWGFTPYLIWTRRYLLARSFGILLVVKALTKLFWIYFVRVKNCLTSSSKNDVQRQEGRVNTLFYHHRFLPISFRFQSCPEPGRSHLLGQPQACFIRHR